jgi:oligopeptide transport system permease protein
MATVQQQQITMVAAEEPGVTQHRGLWTDAYRRLLRNKFAVAGLAVLALVLFVAFVAAQVGPMARYDASTIDSSPGAKQQGPSSDHWFGTDQLGRDMFARVMEGIRASVIIGFSTAGVVLVIGLAIGSLAALGGKFSDQVVMRFTDIMFAFPDILVIILIRSILLEREVPVLSNDVVVIIFAVSMVAWTTIARLVRGQMLSLQERDFVIAARSIGASSRNIVWQHMLPNTLGPVIVAVTFAIPAAIFLEAALSFIGLGIPPPAVSLGGLVSSGYNYVQNNVWAVIFPAAAVALLMLCFTFVGDGLRDALDPRTR